MNNQPSSPTPASLVERLGRLLPRGATVPAVVVALTAVVLGAGTALYVHARGRTNQTSLADAPKPVTVVKTEAGLWRAHRRYVGSIEPWLAARIGPQLVSAYVDTVLVRPGSTVKRGDVVATLDCRNASAASQSVEMQARALQASQAALANEAARVSTLLHGGFASADEVEMKRADADAKRAQLLGLQAQLQGASLQVQDCVLRAPFDGDVAERDADPGAFVRPGTSIATVVDRHIVRVSVEVPESDFEEVAPNTPVRVRVLATKADLPAAVSRRAPAADPATRTVTVEIDVPDPDKTIPVGTTAEVRLDAGEAQPASKLPLAAAVVRGQRATVMVVDGGVARKRSVDVRGESEGELFVSPDLKPGALVVLEGRRSLADGDHVEATVDGTHATTADRSAP